MPLHRKWTGVLIAAIALAACGEETTRATQTTGQDSINACDDGLDACEGNEQCISCLDEGACASGPDPVWTGTECVCAETDPANCAFQYCCAIDFEWDPEACACVPCGDTPHIP
jgi:hypothetical protein